ncbi:hypothetical protein A2810_01940, partial [candidate division Kazan bacterium RIFCSPHIGHO2_01_FULL_49_10]
MSKAEETESAWRCFVVNPELRIRGDSALKQVYDPIRGVVHLLRPPEFRVFQGAVVNGGGVIRTKNGSRQFCRCQSWSQMGMMWEVDSETGLSLREQRLAGDNRAPMVTFYSVPVEVRWAITQACNFRCAHCMADARCDTDPNELTVTEAKAVIREMSAAKIFGLTWTGGEPLLRQDIFELIEYATQHYLASTLVTNGWKVTLGVAGWLTDAGVTQVGVSIDGGTAAVHDAIRGMPGSFERAINGVHNLLSAQVPVVRIMATLQRDNLSEAEAIVRLAVDLGVDAVELNPILIVGRADNSLRLLSDQRVWLRHLVARLVSELQGKITILAPSTTDCTQQLYAELLDGQQKRHYHRGCLAGRAHLFIDPAGSVFPCYFALDQSAGNVKERGLLHMWRHSPVFREMRVVDPGCRGCHYMNVCSRTCGDSLSTRCRPNCPQRN